MFPNDEVVAYGRANGLGSDYNDIMTAFLRDYYSSNLSLTDLWGRAWAEGFRSINGFTDFPGIANSEFYAPLTHSLVLTRGTGDPTYSRATNAWEFDNEGKLITVPSGAARFGGARMVENICKYSENLAGAGWAMTGTSAPTQTPGQSDPYGGTSATLITLPGGDSRPNYTPTYTSPNNQKFCLSLWLKGTAGETVILRIRNPDATTTDTTVTLTSAWARYTAYSTDGKSGGSTPLFYIGNKSAGGTANSFYCYGVQLENVTGQADQTASEYVSTGVLSAPYHGAGVDGVKYFNTSKDGSAISASSLLGYHAEGARTNSLLYSRDLTNAAWVATNITASKTATGIDNAANAASTLTAGAADATILQTLTMAAAARSFSAYVKARTLVSNPDFLLNGSFVGTTNWSAGSGASLSAVNNQITVTLSGGDTFGNAHQAVTLTAGVTYTLFGSVVSETNGTAFGGFSATSTGATIGAAITKSSANSTFTPASTGTYYIVLGVNGANGVAVFSTMSLSVSSAAITRDGGATWKDIGKLINSSTWTRVKIENTSVLNPSVGFKIATSGDAIDVDVCQDEAGPFGGPFVTSPIITTTAAVSRNKDILDYPTSNVSANSSFAGTWYTPTLANSAIQPIIGTKTSSIEGFGKQTTTNKLAIYNPSEAGSATGAAITVNTFNKFAGTLNGTNRAISMNGGAVTSAADASSWTASKLRVNGDGWGTVSEGYLKDVYIWSTALTDAQLQQVTA